MTNEIRAQLEQLTNQASMLRDAWDCLHQDRAGGNDYMACNGCGVMWDYRKEDPDAAEKRLLDALVTGLDLILATLQPSRKPKEVIREDTDVL